MLFLRRKGQGRKAYPGGEVLVFPFLPPARHPGLPPWPCWPSVLGFKLLGHFFQLSVSVSLLYLTRTFPSFLVTFLICKCHEGNKQCV